MSVCVRVAPSRGNVTGSPTRLETCHVFRHPRTRSASGGVVPSSRAGKYVLLHGER